MIVYLDSCIVISLISGCEDARQTLLTQHPAGNDLNPCISGIVKTECLVNVYKQNDEQLADNYTKYFGALKSLPIDDAACDLAARIRATTNLKLPDALHLAIAEVNGCDQFWTCDLDFRSVTYPLNLKILFSRI